MQSWNVQTTDQYLYSLTLTKFWKGLCITDFVVLFKKKIVYSPKFDFQQKHSTSHALIHITDKIRNETDTGYYACGIFLDFQKAFDTLDHHILLKKLKYYWCLRIPKK